MRIGAFDEFAQTGFDRRFGKQLAEDFDLLSQFGVGNRLHKTFRGGAHFAVEFFDLRGSDASDVQRVTFSGELADQSDGLSFRGVDAASSEQQVAHDSIAQVALQSWNSAEARDQPQSP